MKSLEKIQKRAIRIIGNEKYNGHTDPLFAKFKILKIKDMYTEKATKLFQAKILPNDISVALHPNEKNVRVTRTACDGHIALNKQTPVDSLINTILKENTLTDVFVKSLILSKYNTICEVANCYVCKKE